MDYTETIHITFTINLIMKEFSIIQLTSQRVERFIMSMVSLMHQSILIINNNMSTIH